jgi:hypothetical protein
MTAPSEPAGPPPASGVESPLGDPNAGAPAGIANQQGTTGASGLPDAGDGVAAGGVPFALGMAVLALAMAGSLLLIAYNVRGQEVRGG